MRTKRWPSRPTSLPSRKTPPRNRPPRPRAERDAGAAPEAEPAADSATFSRCAACKNAEEVNSAAGTLVCKKHNMLINAEADEIPDDCVEHEPTR